LRLDSFRSLPSRDLTRPSGPSCVTGSDETPWTSPPRHLGHTRRVLAGGVLAASLAISGVAAQTLTPVVTFDAAIERALDRNPTVAQAATSIARAEAILQQAHAVTLPTVTARVNSVTLNSSQGFEGRVTQPQNQVLFGGTVTAPILAPARWAGTSQARDQIEVATRTSIEARQQVAVATAQAYLAVIAAQRQEAVEARALENASAHLDYAQRRLQGGAGSRVNMLRAAQEEASEEVRLENTRLVLRQAQEALGALLAENGPVDTAGQPTFEIPEALDESQWRAARPDLARQTSIIRADERIVRDSWKDVAPSATVSFDPQYIAPAGLFQPSRTWRLTVSLTQPLFQGGLQRAVTRQREATLDASRLVLEGIEIQARTEVRLADASVRSRERALVSARRAAEQAAEVLSITNAAFQLGATTNIEVIDAQRAARDADSAVALAEDAVQRARLDLLVAIGRFPR